MIRRLIAVLTLAVLSFVPLDAAEYFVSPFGSDDNDGTSMQTPFATIQRGVDVLDAGDTLTIAPGEYFGTVRREDLGSLDAKTLIRAEIPGTVILRGDKPAPPFRKVEGYRYVYVTDFDTEAHVVNELDTLCILEAAPNINELEFNPGRFHQDMEAGKLYLSSTDLDSARNHRYTVTVSGTHGIYLRIPRRVTIEGLAVTGFNRYGLLPRPESVTDGATWGIFLRDGQHCVVRDCRAYFNGRGIVLSSGAEHAGDSVIERCVAWANSSRFGGSFGGLSLYQPRRDAIRDSISFLNGHKGVNIRVTDDAARRGEAGLSYLEGNVSWGNSQDIRIKAASSGHIARRNVAMHAIEWFRSIENTLGRGTGAGSERLRSEGTIMLSAESNLDIHAEFADPDNYDYRLQATSRFRGAGPDGADQGAQQYEENIFYVRPVGDDGADGLSVASAWRTLSHAGGQLRPGDTLYIAEGVYNEALTLPAVSGDPDDKISIRGRGLGKVLIQAPVEAAESRGIEFERLSFAAPAALRNSADIAFRNCRFLAPGVSLTADEVDGLRVTQSEFTGFDEAAVLLAAGSNAFFQGNIFDNAWGPALRATDPGAILYSDYNSFRSAARAWQVGGRDVSLQNLQTRRPMPMERYSQELQPEYLAAQNPTGARKPDAADHVGPYGAPVGWHLPQVAYADYALRVDGPVLHSTTATTANIEWWASEPATFEVRWGETPDGENGETLAPINPVHPHGTHLDHFSTYSLTGLKPGTRYHFRLLRGGEEYQALSFVTTADRNRPRDLHVAPDGDDANSGLSREDAWRTVSHAADQARPGDTVWIAGGTYREMVRVRATGEEDAPIVFASVPGEKAVFHGNERLLNTAFNIFNKGHIHVDGLYFQDFGRIWTRGLVNIVRSKDIRVTRCFADGRSRGSSPWLVAGGGVEDVLIQNCVITTPWNAISLGSVNGLRIENNVILRTDISTILVTGRDISIKSNIITDNLSKKSSVTLAPRGSQVELANNCFYLRWPETERSVFGANGGLIEEYNKEVGVEQENIVADPRFQAVAADSDPEDTKLFNDSLPRLVGDFPDAFSTSPDLVERGIGLQPEAFADFHFH